MERVHGETIGRRIVARPAAGLAVQLAEELAKIHAIPPERARRSCGRRDRVERMRTELDSVDEPHPAIEYGLAWVAERLPEPRRPSSRHGDFRIGNLVVDEDGLVAVLDWEFAHLWRPGATTSRGRSSARGASAPTTGASAASARSSRTSSATTS